MEVTQLKLEVKLERWLVSSLNIVNEYVSFLKLPLGILVFQTYIIRMCPADHQLKGKKHFN